MNNTSISISIPSNVYAALKKMAEKDMRSARNYIAKLVIEAVPESMLEKEPEKIIQQHSVTLTKQAREAEDKLYCTACGKEMYLSNTLYIQNGGKCKNCR